MFFVYRALFQGALEAVEQSGEDILDRVQDLICDPPYSTHQNAQLSIPSTNRQNVQDMSSIVEVLLSPARELGVQWHLSCSAQQLKMSYGLLVDEVQDIL